MATNLVSEIAEVLSPNIVSSIASALGLNRTATQKAVGAAATMPMINIPKKPTLAVVSSPSIGTSLSQSELRALIETTTKAWTRRSG